jgi:LuxR family maltose regulon positive regulatory protein
MFVSVNTIRSHVRSILRKLGVGRRNEAVRLAWELRLLPGPGSDPTTLAQ